MRRTSTVLITACALLTLSCATAQGIGTAGAPDPPVDPDAPIALVATEAGLAGVPLGSSTPRWVEPGAVAAPDGSAVFAARARGDGVDVVRIDPRDGGATVVGHRAATAPGTRVAAVVPGGVSVALAAPSDDTTTVADLDTRTGAGRWSTAFEGRLEPEAFSTDGLRLFAARIWPDHYHVHVLDLATGEQYPTLGPDKTQPPEDMVGAVVQATTSPDRTQLATLYRDTTTPGRTAFVHLLSLETGTTVCIDLTAPFGTGDRGADAIEWRADGTVVVGHRSGDPESSMTATFAPAAIWTSPPQRHHHAEVRIDPDPPRLPDGVTATPGYVRFVAIAR